MSESSQVVTPSGAQPGLGGAFVRLPDANGEAGNALRVASVAGGGHALEWFTTYDTATIDALLEAIETTPGEDGASAYEVAVANGFVGDESAWLASLVGEQGPAGADGESGAAGADGAAGPNEVTTATATDLTGVLVGDGSNVSGTRVITAPSNTEPIQIKTASGEVVAEFGTDYYAEYTASGFPNVVFSPTDDYSTAVMIRGTDGSIPDTPMFVVADDAGNPRAWIDAEGKARFKGIERFSLADPTTASSFIKPGYGAWIYDSIAGEDGYWMNHSGTMVRADNKVTTTTTTDLTGVLVGDGASVGSQSSLPINLGGTGATTAVDAAENLGVGATDTPKHNKLRLNSHYDAITVGASNWIGSGWSGAGDESAGGIQIFSSGGDGLWLYHGGAGSVVFRGYEYQTGSGGFLVFTSLPHTECDSVHGRQVAFSNNSRTGLAKFENGAWQTLLDPTKTHSQHKSENYLWDDADWAKGFRQEYDAVGEEILQGLYGVEPVAQATTGITAEAFAANTSGIVDDSATFGGYTIGQVVAALKAVGVLA